MNSIDKTLNERGTRYGAFEGHADITQGLKTIMQGTPNWERLKPDQKEALEMTAHKIGRILNGDPDYLDSWHDIIGYIRLVERRLELGQAPAPNQAMNDGANSSFGANIADALHKSFAAAAAEIKPEPKSDAQLGCGCDACELRRKVESVFGPGVEVRIYPEHDDDEGEDF